MALGRCPQAPTQLSSSPAAPWPVVPAARLLPGCSRAWGSPHPGPQAAPEPSGLEPGERAPRTTWPAGGKAWLCEESSRCYRCPPVCRGPLCPWVLSPQDRRTSSTAWRSFPGLPMARASSSLPWACRPPDQAPWRQGQHRPGRDRVKASARTCIRTQHPWAAGRAPRGPGPCLPQPCHTQHLPSRCSTHTPASRSSKGARRPADAHQIPQELCCQEGPEKAGQGLRASPARCPGWDTPPPSHLQPHPSVKPR